MQFMSNFTEMSYTNRRKKRRYEDGVPPQRITLSYYLQSNCMRWISNGKLVIIWAPSKSSSS